MDPPPHSTTMHLNYPDSVDSSPRYHTTDTINDPLPPVPGAKLRVMCSYGGHIIPRPHDKSLCYVGGETRMVVIDRNSSLSSVVSRLSRSLLDGRPFTLKYQLPNEDLDSLVSVTTNEDLDNMIEEYDRINASSSGLAPSRIRLFLFVGKPETTASMGSLLDDAKSETWFVDALNGSLLPRNLSESAVIECLANLDCDSSQDLEARGEMNKQELMKNMHQEVVQTGPPDSPMENGSSSFGSSSSSPSISNLPPIRVRVDQDQRVGSTMEEQFAKMSFAQALQKQDDGYINGAAAAALPPLPTSIVPVGMAAPLNPCGGSSDNLSRISSEDERSDQGVPVHFRKKPPLQTVQLKPSAVSSNYSLPSPDSVTSDSSVASAGNPLSKTMYYQEQSSGEGKTEISQIQMQQPQNPAYGQYDQQQYMHTNTHYIPQPQPQPQPQPHPVSSYYPIYQTQQTLNNQAMDQHQQQYPVYVMHVPQTQQYMSIQPNVNSSAHPLLYPTPETAAAASVYRTSTTPNPNPTPNPSLVPISGTGQYQQQYVSYAPMQHPSQSLAPGASYGYEHGKGTPEQVYYTQVQAALSLPPQYQTTTAATAVALAADASNQLPMSNTMHQMGTSQQL
ncbi:RAF-like serine/threonine-protein kinase PRAF [Euphorbia lathyris]|uniref:RAF-like serine/threonine-protein kinase PRAF n=1 Tax=Euphorbia lathyris TaxID=212925 RepID=UPI003314213A